MPTTVISPTVLPLNKVSGEHDCLEYTFQNDDGVISPESIALTEITVTNDPIPSNEGFVLSNLDALLSGDIRLDVNGGSIFDGYTLIEPNATPAGRRDMVIDAMTANPYLNSRYNIYPTGTPTGTEAKLRIEAKNPGNQYTLTTTFTTGQPTETWMSFQLLVAGANAQPESNFSFIVQLWELVSGNQEFRNEWLVPGKYNADIQEMSGTFDLAKAADLYLTHHKANLTLSNIIKAEGLAARFLLKHGIAYDVNGDFKPFALQELPDVKVFKGTSRRLTGIDTSLFATAANGQKFITTMPVDGQITFSSLANLWLYLYIPDGTTNIDVNIQIDTQPGVIGPNNVFNISAGITEGIYTFPAGPGNLGIPDLQNPGVISYEIWAQLTDGSGTWETERASFQVDVNCQNNVQFFFRNQCGTIDTIEFQRIIQGSVSVRNSEHCQFVQCGEAISEEGIQISSSTSYEFFQALAQIHAKYGEEYIKDFYRSTWKGTAVNGQLVTIIPRSSEYAITRIGELNFQSVFGYRYNIDEKQ